MPVSGRTIMLGLIIALVVIALLGTVFREQTGAFIHEHYTGPVISDAAEEEVDGIEQGYNPVSTITYGLFVIVSLFLIYLLYRKVGIEIDAAFIAAVIPFIVLGVLLRVLEDSGLFTKPSVYMFISPIIYVIVGLLAVGASLYGHWLKRIDWREAAFHLAVIVIAVTALHHAIARSAEHQIHSAAPLVAGLIFIPFILERKRVQEMERQNKRIDGKACTTGKDECPTFCCPMFRFTKDPFFAIGLFLLLIPIAYLHAFLTGTNWTGEPLDTNPEVIPLTFVLAAIATAATVLLARLHKSTKFLAIAMGIPLFFAHYIDASATFLGVGFYDAWEKHPLPRAAMDATGTSAVMYPLKFVVVAAFLYLFTVEYRKDFEKNMLLRNLIYAAVLILGLAPGLRSMLRLAMGV